jgi:RNA polymerase sigma factor (TIGR02999 family)
MLTAPQATQYLVSHTAGDASAADKLMPIVYQELRALAQHYLGQEMPGHTLEATALVNEAYLRLVDQSQVDWKGKTHFFAIAAEMIRRILIDHARARKTSKRGGGRKRDDLDSAVVDPDSDAPLDLLALDDALSELAKLNGRHARVVELRFFGGLTEEEAAYALDVSRETVKRDWRAAKAWLQTRLKN